MYKSTERLYSSHIGKLNETVAYKDRRIKNLEMQLRIAFESGDKQRQVGRYQQPTDGVFDATVKRVTTDKPTAELRGK